MMKGISAKQVRTPKEKASVLLFVTLARLLTNLATIFGSQSSVLLPDL